MEAKEHLTKRDVVDAAREIVATSGVPSLSMRKLSSKLGVAVTAIYWHVGNRDSLLDALIDRELSDWKSLSPTGKTCKDRILSLARELRERLLLGRNIMELASERGRIFDIFIPTYDILAGEFLEGGLGIEQAALAVRTLQFHVVGSVILQRRAERDPSSQQVPLKDGEMDAQVSEEHKQRISRVTFLALQIPPDIAFETATELLVDGLLAGVIRTTSL